LDSPRSAKCTHTHTHTYIYISLPCATPENNNNNDIPYLIQRPRRVAGQGEVQIERQVLHLLGRLAQGRVWLDLGQAVRHEPDAVDQQAVGGALDLKVAEEGVCAEEREHLVEYVVRLGVGIGRLVGRQRRLRER